MKSLFVRDLDHMNSGDSVTLKGWAQDIKTMKSVGFIILRDSTGLTQVTVKKDSEFFDKLGSMNRESVIEVDGKIPEKIMSKIGREIIISGLAILNTAEVPLPLGITDEVEVDPDTRYNNRFLDLRKERNHVIFQIKSALLWGIRNYLMTNGFMEVQTPKTVSAATEGGAELFRVKYFEKDIFLNQSPQLYKQMLIASGIERVFEVGPAFRAEEHNTPRHINEFTSIDIEMAFADHNDAMKMLENAISSGVSNFLKNVPDADKISLMKETPKIPFPKITYNECVNLINRNGGKQEFGEDISNENLKIIGKMFDNFYFITNWPTSVRPFYTAVLDEDPSLTKSYDLQFREIELTSGAQRIHDPNELRKRIESKGLNSENFEFYIKTFRYGMPPHAGWGLGLERLTQVVLGLQNIREASLFPRDRTRVFP